jgi:hypothetical protein
VGNRGSFLLVGDALHGGDYLVSPNGQYSAVMQDDGNFVLYWGCPPDKLVGAMWTSDTSGLGDMSLSMQHDGNLVVYRDGKAQWASNTTGKSGSLFALLANDGNFLLYQGTPDKPGTAYWDTATGQVNIWVKNKGVYVANAWIDVNTSNIAEGKCGTIIAKASRSAKLTFDVVFGEKAVGGKVALGALRSKRYLMTGTSGNAKVEPQTGHGSF